VRIITPHTRQTPLAHPLNGSTSVLASQLRAPGIPHPSTRYAYRGHQKPHLARRTVGSNYGE